MRASFNSHALVASIVLNIVFGIMLHSITTGSITVEHRQVAQRSLVESIFP